MITQRLAIYSESFKALAATVSRITVSFLSFLSLLGWHTLPSHASAEACLTGWHNAHCATPGKGLEYSVARHHPMVCVACSCCATSPYKEVCWAKGWIGSGETLCHDI